MTVQIESTSDSKEAVTAAMSNLASDKPVVEKPVKEVPSDESEKESEKEVEEPSEETPETEEEDKEEAEEVEAKGSEQKPKKKGGFQKKIDKLSQKVAQAEQEREYWRQEALRAKPVQTEQPRVEAKPDLSKRPKADDFKTVDEYQEALTDWKVDQRLASERQKAAEEAVKNEVQAKFGKHHERVEEFKKSHEDFEDEWNEAVQKVGEANLSLTVREVIVNSDMGPELMKELADNPKEFKRICSLSAINAAKELGKIEARLTKTTTPSEETKTKSKVPTPVKTVRTKGATTAIGYRDDMTQREYEAWRNSQSKRS